MLLLCLDCGAVGDRKTEMRFPDYVIGDYHLEQVIRLPCKKCGYRWSVRELLEGKETEDEARQWN